MTKKNITINKRVCWRCPWAGRRWGFVRWAEGLLVWRAVVFVGPATAGGLLVGRAIAHRDGEVGDLRDVRSRDGGIRGDRGWGGDEGGGG